MIGRQCWRETGSCSVESWRSEAAGISPARIPPALFGSLPKKQQKTCPINANIFIKVASSSAVHKLRDAGDACGKFET